MSEPAEALTGLDSIRAGADHGLAGRRVALLCNYTAVDAHGRHAVEVFAGIEEIEIVRLLAPEHGVWATHQDMEPVASTIDPVFELEVASLYGHTRDSLAPRPEALGGVDAIVYDIRDIGCRFYTYAASLALAMEAAQDVGIGVWVLNRANPIGPRREGPLLRAGFESFCGLEPGLPIRHGLDVGALARWFRSRRAPSCELVVVDGTAGPEAQPPWVPPSPNMPTPDTALVYPGMCLLEGTTVSEGRGTTTPFLTFGAPGVDPTRLVAALRGQDLEGVDFVPRLFRPEFQKHAGQLCGGAQIRVLAPDRVRAVDLGVRVIEALKRTAPDAFGWRADAYEFVTDIPAIDLLWGSPDLRMAIDTGADIGPLLEGARREADAWDPTT